MCVKEIGEDPTDSGDRARALSLKQRMEDKGDMVGPGSPPPHWGPARAGRGGIQAARAAPPPVYLSPGSRAASFSTLSAQSPLTLRPRRLRQRNGSVAATPSCPRPVSALTAPSLSAHTVSSAEAAAAVASFPFRSHGVSNRSPLPLQPPFPPFHRARGASRVSIVGGVGRRSDEPQSRRRRRGKLVTGASAEQAH